MGFFGLGELPKEYNRKIHRPYDPATYYGKKDPSLAETKVGELPKWLSRRSFTPTAAGRCVSRAYWRWSHKFVQPRYTGIVSLVQVATLASFKYN